MQPDFDSRGVTRPLSAFLRLAMLGCPARRARGQLAAGACAPEPGRGADSSVSLDHSHGQRRLTIHGFDLRPNTWRHLIQQLVHHHRLENPH